MLNFFLLIAFVLSGSDTSFSCQEAKLRMPHSNADIVQFVVNNTHYPATFEETIDDTDYYSFSFPEDGQALTGHQTFGAIVIDGEYIAIKDALTADCGGTNNNLFLPIVRK